MSPTSPPMSDEAVKAATGKTWPQWFQALDKAGARMMPHRDIALHLHNIHKCPGWWSQMVAVGYERERGLRETHQKCDGSYAASASRTLHVPVGILYKAWTDAKALRRWLPDPFEVRKATSSKSLRITWPDGSHVDVYFWIKGPSKSQVSLDHRKLKDARAVAKQKAYWSRALDRLEERLFG